jgi:hypothetical protein
MKDEAMYDIASISKSIKELLGRVLRRIRLGGEEINSRNLKQVIKNQIEPQTSPAPPAFNLGNILIASGQINREQLDAALEQQKNSTKKIGELLIDGGYLQQSQVDQGLHLQYLLVAAALGTVVAVCPPVSAEAGSSSASLNATATVKSIARVKVLYQQPQMVITEKDIAMGYIEMQAASRLEVRNTSQSGYMILFEIQDGPFRDVLIRGLGTDLHIGQGNGWLVKPHVRGPELLELTYRFVLMADASPGAYPWPVQISAMAI